MMQLYLWILTAKWRQFWLKWDMLNEKKETKAIRLWIKTTELTAWGQTSLKKEDNVMCCDSIYISVIFLSMLDDSTDEQCLTIQQMSSAWWLNRWAVLDRLAVEISEQGKLNVYIDLEHDTLMTSCSTSLIIVTDCSINNMITLIIKLFTCCTCRSIQ